jgi:hypothetical protein
MPVHRRSVWVFPRGKTSIGLIHRLPPPLPAPRRVFRSVRNEGHATALESAQTKLDDSVPATIDAPTAAAGRGSAP